MGTATATYRASRAPSSVVEGSVLRGLNRSLALFCDERPRCASIGGTARLRGRGFSTEDLIRVINRITRNKP
jgi:hypothetical protein